VLDLLAELVATKLEERIAPTPAVSPQPLLDRKKLAEALGCSLPTVDKLTREGLPHLRVGDSPRYELDRAIEHLRARGAVDGG